MADYLKLGHMSEFKPDPNEILISYYLPHHAVVQSTKCLTTKVKVASDASAKTDSGLSFKDVQYVGLTLQDHIFSILLHFRKYKYFLSADISKIYRNI